jgi:hypothetical protein
MRHGLAVSIALVALSAACVSVAPASAKSRSYVFYAKATRAQFIDHSDDRDRGNIINPFNSDAALPTPKNANGGKAGSHAGDNAIFTLKLFSDAGLKNPVGSATYSCTFNFGHEALCEANFTLTNGTMIALGPANLDSPEFILPVTGGTGGYNGAHGQMTSVPSSGNKTSQIIRFQLV